MNPATRVLSVLDSLAEGRSSLDPNTPMLQVWGHVFKISGPIENDVVACLLAFRNEIELVVAKLQERGASQDLFEPGLSRLTSISSTGLLQHPWSSYFTEGLKVENRIPFAWAAWILRDEDEDEIDDAELKEIARELDALQASLDDLEMSLYLRRFVLKQIDVIRRALRVYRVQGLEPVRSALQQVAGTYMTEKSRISEENAKATPEVQSRVAKAVAIAEKVGKVCDSVDKVHKLGTTAWPAISAAWRSITS